jgi:oxaloacetate decarboxylase alpha subunit
MEYDSFHYSTRCRAACLRTGSSSCNKRAGNRFDEILQEIVQIRADLGWPIMVTPFSQIIGVQAMLNVVGGERYRTVPDEVKMYALGHFGKLLAPVDPNVLDRIVANGSSKIPLKPQSLSPALPSLRKAYPAADDDERILRYMFAGSEADEMFAAGPLNISSPRFSPVARLIEELAKRPQVRFVDVQKKNTRLVYSRGL